MDAVCTRECTAGCMEDGYMLDGDGVDGVVVVRSLILHLDHMPDTVAEARPGRPVPEQGSR